MLIVSTYKANSLTYNKILKGLNRSAAPDHPHVASLSR